MWLRQFLFGEKLAGFGQIGCGGVQAERAQHGDDASRGFRHRRVFDEQRAPDRVRSLTLAHLPVLFGLEIGGTKQFGFQIVIRDQFIDAPQPEAAERRHEQVRVDVDKRRFAQFGFDRGGEIGSSKRFAGCRLRGAGDGIAMDERAHKRYSSLEYRGRGHGGSKQYLQTEC